MKKEMYILNKIAGAVHRLGVELRLLVLLEKVPVLFCFPPPLSCLGIPHV